MSPSWFGMSTALYMPGDSAKAPHAGFGRRRRRGTTMRFVVIRRPLMASVERLFGAVDLRLWVRLAPIHYLV